MITDRTQNNVDRRNALAMKGFFPEEVLDTLRKEGSILQGHPDMKKRPGIDISTGSLGQGFACAVGMAIAGIPMGRPGETREVANAIVFLASKEASYITGEEIAAREGDIVDDLFQADNDFHDTVSLLCKNPQVDKINRVVRVLTHAVRYDTVKTMVTTGRQEELVQAHCEIYEVLHDCNTAGLEDIIRDTYFLNISGQ